MRRQLIHGAEFDPQRDPDGFGRGLTVCILGLVSLYAVYAVGALVALGPDISIAQRLVRVFGMATFPVPTMVAPAVFFAALDRFDLYGQYGSRLRRRHWSLLVIVALSAYVVCAVGPAIFDRAMEAVMGPSDAIAREGMIAEDRAQLAAPFAVALTVLVGGLAGAVIGRMTLGLTRARRQLARWAAAVALFVSFWITLVGVGELITMHGVLSPTWLALAPPGVPFLLTCVLAHRECLRMAGSLLARIRHGAKTMDPVALDDLVSAVINSGDGDDEVVSTLVDEQSADPEMAALVAGIRRVATSRTGTSELQVRRIVATLTKAPPVATRRESAWNVRRAVDRARVVGAFVGASACLSLGLLVSGGAGTAAPVVVSAIVSGCLGAGVIVWMSQRTPVPALVRTMVPR